ncbi:Adenine-specific DNA methylase, contains a Zn-ribbon domain [Candidatus Fervidibacteria bacterium JGI MDM2 SSWTFF-3-K9]
MAQRFLIERALPIKALSEEARREKAIRHGHISTLHVWWARRPLVVARAAVLGALLTEDDDVDERFIANLCKWEVHDGDPAGRYLLEQARNLIRKRFGDQPPKVLDSFAGGGSIPLEALRLGCKAYALEYNPVAYIILKATIEFPQRFGQKIVNEVKRWGEWVLEKAREELAEFYPAVSSETPIAYIWSRTIKCPNPSCGAEIPLFRQFWLARKDNKKVALKPIHNREANRVDFAIVHGNDIDFDPSKGTVSKGNAVCLVCGTSVKDKYVKAEAQAGRMGHRLVAVVTTRGKGQGRNYRLATKEDFEAFRKAQQALQNLTETPSPWAFGLSWVPEEEVEQIKKRPLPVWLDDLYLYNMPRWCDLFNPRQLLSLCTFGKWVREAYRQILRKTNDPEFAKAVTTYLAFGVDFVANYNCVLSSWRHLVEAMRSVFAGHHLHMVWDYTETNPLQDEAGSGWDAGMEWLIRYLTRESRIPQAGFAHLGSAASLPFPDKHFDAVIIDPPYHDNVPYADLSDFFHVWLRRTIGDLYPEAFKWTLTPKDEEAVVNPARFGGGKKGEQIAQAHYQRLMQKSFEEIYRVLKPEGMAVVMFTHRSTEAWERLIQSLLDAGLYPTASFPVHTEMEASTHQRGKGAIRSTILMACRRRPENAPIGWYAQVRAEMEQVIPQRLKEFWDAGIRGADFFISAIGPSVGVFGRFRKVMHPDGREVSIGELLDEVRTIVTNFALERLGFSRLDEPTRFYVLYRWAYGGDELEFDEANKLAKSVGGELDALQEQQRLIKRDGSTVTLLTFTERWQDKICQGRWRQALENGTVAQLPEIDQLHIALSFWRRGETENLAKFLRQAGIQDETHPFWQTAQAILEAESNHNGNRTNSEAKVQKGRGSGSRETGLQEEVKALEQLLASKRSVLRQAASLAESQQQTLF